MSAEVACPHCNWTLVFEPDAVGQHVTCWNCQGAFVLLAAAEPNPPPAEEPAVIAAVDDRPPPSRAVWVVAAVAVVAVGLSVGVAWVHARRAIEAERVAERVRAELAAAGQAAETARQDALAARQDAESARDRLTELTTTVTRAAPPADEPGGMPRDIPADVRDAATATLRRAGEVAVPLFRKALEENRSELARLKNPFRPVAFPLQTDKAAAIAACERRIAAAERAVKAWETNDLAFFAPILANPAERGAVGRIPGQQVRVARVLGPDAAVVEFPVGPTKAARSARATAVVTGINGGPLAEGQTAAFADVVVVAGSVTVDQDTYPRLVVFAAAK